MERIIIKLALCLGLVISGNALAKSAEGGTLVQQLVDLMGSHVITIIGEKHRRPESVQLTADLTDKLTDNGSCLTVALEIPSDQQPALDTALKTNESVSAVYIAPMIDHSPFRTFLEDLRDLMQMGKCLTVSAVDAPLDALGGRDLWMTDQIEKLPADHRVVALMGNLHAMKVTQWESGMDDPFLAERLKRRGFDVLSVIQTWDEGCEDRTGRWYAIDHPRALAVVRETLNVAALHQPERLEVVADGVVVWECDSR